VGRAIEADHRHAALDVANQGVENGIESSIVIEMESTCAARLNDNCQRQRL
jgi:hypothetical protein